MKKILKVGIPVCLLLGVVCGGIFAYMKLYPFLLLKNTLIEVMNEDYTYRIDASMENIPIPGLGDDIQFRLKGRKAEDIVFGKFYMDDKEMIKVYANMDRELVLGVTPLLDFLIDEVDKKTSLPVSLLKLAIGNVYVSLEDIEELTGKKITTIRESGITLDTFRGIINNEKSADYTLEILSADQVKEAFLEEEAVYFRLAVEQTGTVAVLAIPKSKNVDKIAMQVDYKGMHWDFYMTYQITEVDPIEIPASNIPDKVKDVFKMIRDYL